MVSKSPNPRIRVNQAILDGLAQDGLLDFEATMARNDGEEVKVALEERQVHKLILSDRQPYFLKRTFSVPLGTAFRRMIFGHGVHSRPGCEWNALSRLAELGVPAPVPVICTEEYQFGGVRRAFILTKGLAVRMSLEKLVADGGFVDGKQIDLNQLASQVATLLSTMHHNGINHRDFYLGHLFLGDDLKTIFVMDLDRADCRSHVSERWRVKDLAALHFSTPLSAFSKRQRLRFLRRYLGGTLRGSGRLQRLVAQKAAKIRRHVSRKVDQQEPNFHLPPNE